jgi:hypothetical protein
MSSAISILMKRMFVQINLGILKSRDKLYELSDAM